MMCPRENKKQSTIATTSKSWWSQTSPYTNEAIWNIQLCLWQWYHLHIIHTHLHTHKHTLTHTQTHTHTTHTHKHTHTQQTHTHTNTHTHHKHTHHKLRGTGYFGGAYYGQCCHSKGPYFGPFISMHKWVGFYLPFQDVHAVNIG